MRWVARISIMVLCAACGDGGLPPLAGDDVRVRFPAGGIVDVIEVDAVNRLPLRKVELIAADGQATPAAYLNVNPSPSATSYQGLSSPYAGNAFGVDNIATGMPPLALTGGTPQHRAAFLAMISTASIPLLDPVEYRRNWRSYRVRLSFGDASGEVETREVDAPEPPPGG
jgi:hypothetical protein